jgi:hypothetical protein
MDSAIAQKIAMEYLETKEEKILFATAMRGTTADSEDLREVRREPETMRAEWFLQTPNLAQWAVEKGGCPTNEMLILAAEKGGPAFFRCADLAGTDACKERKEALCLLGAKDVKSYAVGIGSEDTQDEQNVVEIAATRGHVEVIRKLMRMPETSLERWIYADPYKPYETISLKAAQHDAGTPVLRWMVQQDMPVHPCAACEALMDNREDVAIWLFETQYSCRQDRYLGIAAAILGAVGLVRAIVNRKGHDAHAHRNFPQFWTWDDENSKRRIQQQFGKEVLEAELLEVAADRNQIGILYVLKNTRYAKTSWDKAFLAAVRQGAEDAAKWIWDEKRNEIKTTTLDEAVRSICAADGYKAFLFQMKIDGVDVLEIVRRTRVPLDDRYKRVIEQATLTELEIRANRGRYDALKPVEIRDARVDMARLAQLPNVTRLER